MVKNCQRCTKYVLDIVVGHKYECIEDRHCSGAVCRDAWIIGVGTTAKLVIEQCFKKFHPKVRNHGEGPY